MTEQRSWLWRKKSSEKQYIPSKSNDEEIQVLLSEKAEMEKELKIMSDKLSLVLSECNANNELSKKNAKMAQDALAGWEKAEAKASSLKEELDESLDKRESYEERTIQLEAALKECMQQLRFVREEKEQRIHDVLSKLAKDYEEEKLQFEEKLSESGRKIAELRYEITELSQIIFLKEKLAEEMNRKLVDANAELKEVLTRLESTDKCNSKMKYEVQVLEKELRIRNEERDFNRQSANATHVQHLENVKKIAKLESECQRLRVLVRKRLPGPAALTRMKNEVEMLERRPNGSNSSPESPAKKINVLVEKLHALEDENTSLRETLEKKTNALQISRNMYAQASLKLTQAEAQLEELSKTRISRHLSRASVSDFGFDDKVSCAWSSASTLISEMTEKGGCVRSPMSNARSSEINLMDDFVEMEKLALVYVDKPIEFGRESEFETPCFPVASTSGYQGAIPLLKIQSNLKEEIGQLKDKVKELEHAKKEVEEKLESLSNELEITKSENEDLNTQLSVAKIHLDHSCEKLLSLQAEIEYKTKRSKELEARCNELQIQLKSVTAKDVEEVRSHEDEKQLQTNWDITTASEKLAQCQETIFSLGKQLKEMSYPHETSVLEKVISSSSRTHLPPAESTITTTYTLQEKDSSHRSSLLDKMLAGDSDECPETKEVVCTPEPVTPPPGFLKGNINPTFESDWIGQSFRETGFRSLPLVPMKKQKNDGPLKKLLWRKRNGYKINKMLLAFSAC